MSLKPNNIQHVSDTALWVASYRAQESLRPDALFKDPYAHKLAGDKGRAIAAIADVNQAHPAWVLSIRTAIIDQLILDYISHGIDTILNLGCGLDTRPYRLTLPSHLLWIEADFSHMIDYKSQIMKDEKPQCHLERHSVDLSNDLERSLFLENVAKDKKNILVLTEGVIPYLTEQQVAALAKNLLAYDGFKYWIAEYFSTEVYRFLKAPKRMEFMKNSPFQFFPKDWFQFFKSQGWEPLDIKYLGIESDKFKRPIPVPKWAIIFWLIRPFVRYETFYKFKKFTAYVVYSRSSN